MQSSLAPRSPTETTPQTSLTCVHCRESFPNTTPQPGCGSRGMKRISLPLPRHHTPPSQAGVCRGSVTAQGCHETHTPGSHLSRPLPQPHGLVVSSTPPRPDGPGGNPDVAQRRCPSFTTCPVLPHPAHKASRGGRRRGRSVPEERKCCQPNHILQHPETLCQDKRPQPSPGEEGEANEDTYDSLLAANPLITFSIPGDLPSTMI